MRCDMIKKMVVVYSFLTLHTDSETDGAGHYQQPPN